MPQLTLSIVLLLLISASLYFVISNTHVSPLTFMLGAVICLIVQLVILCAYCFFKLQRTYRQAHTIKLTPKPTSQLDLQELCPFEKVDAVQGFYFNKYTDQAKLRVQRQQIKTMEPTHQDQQCYFQQFQIDQPKKQTMSFLKQMQSYQHTLNTINYILINFGQDLKFIEKGSIFEAKKYHFAQFQKNYSPQSPTDELTIKQSAIFQQTNTKLFRTAQKNSKILFPSWSSVISLFKFIGNQYHKIETMRQSNSQMLEMIHKKIRDDFQLLQKKLMTIGSQLNQSIKLLNDLQKDYAKYRDIQFNTIDTNQPHVEMVHWFKKQIYQFRDLQKRIKQTEFNLKQKSSQKKYYQQKIVRFKGNAKKQFIKNVKYCFIAFLDSYHITVDESIKRLQESFNKQSKNVSQIPIPHVKNFIVSKNLNQTIQAQKNYQKQYFQRVQYYEKVLDDLILSMDSLGVFLKNLKTIFGECMKNLQKFHQSSKIQTQYFANLTVFLLQRAQPIYYQLSQLIQTNKKVKQTNTPILQSIKKQIKLNKTKIVSILSQINLQQGPMMYKYNLVRIQVEECYQFIQQKINKIIEFQQLYLLHSGRVKKIIISQLIDFLNRQLKKIDIGKINGANNNIGASGNALQNTTNLQIAYALLVDQGTGSLLQKANLHQQMEEQNSYNLVNIEQQSLKTDSQLSPTYLKFLNQLLFVFYTQWKTSNFFKSELQKQLFIAFNKQPNESFSKIEVSQLEFQGLPPQIKWLRQLKSQDKQAFFDVNLAFKGAIKFKVNTIYKLIRDIPVQVMIQIQQFYCVMRFCFAPASVGKGWFSFIGQPISKFKIVPSIANYRFDIQTLRTMFNNFLLNKLKKNTYPIKQPIAIPASKKDNDFEMIEKRFKVLEQNQGYK